jgi:hypothetical protein
MLVERLAALTPRAVQALAGSLDDKSGYIRLKAAKDILNRNGVGVAPEPVCGAPLLIRINLGSDAPARDAPQSQSPEIAPQRKKSPPISVANASDINNLSLDDPEPPTSLPTTESALEPQMRSDVNNFSQDENDLQVAEKQPGGQKSRNKISAGSPTHDFFPKVRAEDATEELELEGEGKEEAGSRFDELDL